VRSLRPPLLAGPSLLLEMRHQPGMGVTEPKKVLECWPRPFGTEYSDSRAAHRLKIRDALRQNLSHVTQGLRIAGVVAGSASSARGRLAPAACGVGSEVRHEEDDGLENGTWR